MDDRTCNTCKWSSLEERSDGRCHTLCRLLPPILIPAEPRPRFGWPTVEDDDWCGEWKLRQ